MWKRFIATLLICLSLITLVPESAKAFTEGIIGSGGSGDPWIMGAKSWPCFTITILEDTYRTPIKELPDAKKNYEGIQEFREQVRTEYKDKIPEVPCWESDTYGRLYIMPTWLNGNVPVDSVQDILKYDYNFYEALPMDRDSSWRNMYKLSSPVGDIPSSFKEMRGKLYDYIKANKGNCSDLYDKWGTAETKTEYSYDEAIQALCYLFKTDTGIETRLGAMLYDDYYGNHPDECFTDDGQYYQKAAMIAVGMVLYYAAYDDKIKSYYQRRINEFITNDDDKNKKTPFIIEIEPASIWVNKTGQYRILNCIDFLDMYSGTDWDGSIRMKGWNTNAYDIFQLMSQSWTRSLNKFTRDEKQQRFYFTQGQRQDEYTYGFSLPTGIWYGLNGSQVDTAMGTVPGYVKNFYFFQNMYGFLLGFNSSLLNGATNVKGTQDISTEDPELKSVDQHQETIPENPKITLRSTTKDTEISEWVKKYGDTKPEFIIAAGIVKTKGPNTVVNAMGALPNDLESGVKVSYEELLQFLQGTLTFDFEDQLIGTPIANDQIIENEYKSTVKIAENKLVDGGYTRISLEPDDGIAKKNYQREPITPYYVSSPVTYSEIKNNEPEHEEWEAMAGVPTTEQLYFASGGSEFVVDIELEYIADQSTVRNYKDIFTSVKCADWAHVPNDEGGHTGACHEHTIPQQVNTWTQTINYDYMKINKCQVWKIEKSKVDGMSKITRADDEITATIQTGDPSAFWNVAKSDDAKGGRIMYSLYPEQLDSVTWTQSSSNNHSSYKSDNDKVTEQHKAMVNQATVVSDFLVLQTNKGDQSVMYFDKKSNAIRCDTDFTFEKSNEDTMWKNNSNSAANWEEDYITTSSYNGKYKNVDTKYKSKGQASNIATAFDSASYGQVMNRPSRPGNQMLLYETFDPYVKNINGLYKTGDAVTFYKHIVDEGKPSGLYSDEDEAKAKFGSDGFMLESNYSPSHSKVNDIVFHDPVSSEKAMVIPLPEERDQRTADTKPALSPPKQDAIEYIDVLPDDYMNNMIFNGYCRYLNSKKEPLGWLTSSGDISKTAYSGTTSSVIKDDESAWSKEHDKYWDGIQRSFLIQNSGSHSSYLTQTFNVEAGKTFTLKGYTDGANTYVGISFLDDKGNNLGDHRISADGSVTASAPSGTVSARVYLLKQGSGDGRFDNIQLYCESNKGRFTENNTSALDWKTIRNPLYHSHGESGCTKVVSYNCNNLPLNAGGTIAYEYRSQCSNHGYSYFYLSENVGSTVNTTTVDKGLILKKTENCSAYPSVMSYVGTTFLDAPTYHVHTSACIDGNSDIITDWNFSSGLNGFTSGTAKISSTGGALHSNISNTDGYFYRPTINKDSSSFDTIEVTVKNNSNGTHAEIYFAPSGGSYSDARHVNFTMNANSDYTTYKVKMSTHEKWTGTIKSVRFDLANGVSTGSFDVSSIRLLKSNGTGGITWSCGREDTSKPYKVLDKCTGELNAGGSGKYYLITHKKGCDYEYKTHISTSSTKCTQCGHTCGGTIEEKTTFDRHEHTDACYSIHPAEVKEIMGWYASNIQPYRNPQSWEYIQKIKEPDPYKEIVTPSGTFTPGNFINLDYPFQVYFPNEGDFEGTNELGIRKTTKDRGYGFEDNMDTTKWTVRKYVKFEFDVIFKGKLYGAGEEINLDVDEDTFDFYCPLENKEYISSKVMFVSIAINNKYNSVDNDQTTNKVRGSSRLRANHSAVKSYFIDVVGRIGNMTIQDTGDFRFANFFKKSFNNGEWLIPNMVPTVDMNSQNYIVGDQKDIRGVKFEDNKGAYLNTYGTEDYKEQKPYAFPLNPTYNNIEALRRQPLRIGYPVFMDVSTLGDYMKGKVQVLPYYYALDLQSGKIEPVDIYMSVNSSYKLINRFNKLKDDGTINTDNLYDNKVFLNWTEESIRRNYTGEQINLTIDGTDFYTNRYTNANINGYEGPKDSKMEPPYGQFYVMGNNNALILTPRARTLFATEENYDGNKNPGKRVNKFDYTIQGQRWHFTITLPSTAVAVKAGKQPTTSNIEEVCNDKHVILTSLDLKAMGEHYTLKTDVKNTEISIQTIKPTGEVSEKTYDISSIPNQVVTVTSSNKTSRDDLAVSGTH